MRHHLQDRRRLKSDKNDKHHFKTRAFIAAKVGLTNHEVKPNEDIRAEQLRSPFASQASRHKVITALCSSAEFMSSEQVFEKDGTAEKEEERE